MPKKQPLDFPISDVAAAALYGEDHDLARLDEANAAYKAEYDRWCVRRKTHKDGYELVRNTSPHNDLVSDDFMDVIPLTKREAPTHDHAEEWLDTVRGRAAMAAALATGKRPKRDHNLGEQYD